MLIILDWDGTLVDSAERISECLVKAGQALDQYDVDAEHAKQVIGLGLDEAIRELYPYLDKQQVARCRALYAEYFIDASQVPNNIFPNVLATLKQLKEDGHFLAVATGKSRRGLDRELAQLEMSHYFDSSRCSDETASKPDPQMLYEILEEFQYESHQCLMVGDTVFDLEMAQQAKIPAVAVNYGVHDEDRLLTLEPLALIDNFAALLEVVNDIELYDFEMENFDAGIDE